MGDDTMSTMLKLLSLCALLALCSSLSADTAAEIPEDVLQESPNSIHELQESPNSIAEEERSDELVSELNSAQVDKHGGFRALVDFLKEKKVDGKRGKGGKGGKGGKPCTGTKNEVQACRKKELMPDFVP